ncbi:transcriptional regulator, TetR family [Ruminiclostridium papyrosolvens DSM 2782]|uniref:Transcriptional regulator, TetR family n=1 Tax=Ruminiclostridium papyrosolvens DSM 2782 TaxID=588581 RepID=F1T947_9FIRM|nr:TetR/AcrR family transcriptional regulator [Ruminiclostridium papyrosolvens]EGD49029.1 transcriptional regulator, TetR family [Ruminiclostridium papyrosolvens DSM 2782]WES35512.1 TetR/AcrR family transcriptional regulator [Ruminiclostridium papyrosolvens DSM 2782]
MEREVRKPVQKRSQEKKEKIKNVAIKLFSEKGYHNVSTNEIAKSASISIGTLYNYFSDKKAIYDELVGDLYTKILSQITPEVLSPSDSPIVLLERYVNLIMEGHTYMTNFQREITSLSYQNAEFRKLDDNYRAIATEKILLLLQKYENYLRITNLDTVSFILQTCIEAVIHEVQFYEIPYDKAAIIKELIQMLSRYLFRDEYINAL